MKITFFKRLCWSAIIAVMLSVYISQAAMADQMSEVEKCFSDSSNSSLDPIRGYVEIWKQSSVDLTKAQLDRLPTDKEKKALAQLYSISTECIKGDINDINAHDELSPNGLNYLTMLSKLRDGEITYAKFTNWWQLWQKRTQEFFDNRRKYVNLSCTTESPSKFAGDTWDFTFNEDMQTFRANRGGKPENVNIGTSEISYNFKSGDTLGDTRFHVTISRNTGGFSVNSEYVHVRGTCHSITERKF